MSSTGLGAALRILRDRRTLSVREISKLSDVDHAYIHRLEVGEKTNPSPELVAKLLKALKPSDRDGVIVKWLVEHPDTSPELVDYTLANPEIDIEVFTIAAGARHRGITRPDPSLLIERVRRAFAATQDDD